MKHAAGVKMNNIDQIPGVPKKRTEVKYPKADWSEGSYNDKMQKAADAKRKKYGTDVSYNGY